jgi:hypothetical protein
MDFKRYGLLRQPPKNWLLIINLLIAVILAGFCLILEWSADPPDSRYEQARKAVAYARRSQANVYVPELLQNAELYLEQARQAWASENRRWMMNRDFYLANSYAEKAADQAEQAAMRAVAVRDSLRWVAQTGIEAIKEQIEQVRPQLIELPLENLLRQKMTLGELLIMESEAAFKRGDYRRAVARYRVAASKIGSAGDDVEEALAAYFANTPKWRRWVQETLDWSVVNQDVVILVDKLAHVCHVISGGEKLAEYTIELGPNWLGHKRQRGDGATPEGRYRIRKKKSDRQTVYYKALEIDYPNLEDQTSFHSAKHRGEISARASIGGLIEIHGDGGRGANWTAGCVALRNRDMDRLYEVAKVGTPVTIVGSLRGMSLKSNATPNNGSGQASE